MIDPTQAAIADVLIAIEKSKAKPAPTPVEKTYIVKHVVRDAANRIAHVVEERVEKMPLLGQRPDGTYFMIQDGHVEKSVAGTAPELLTIEDAIDVRLSPEEIAKVAGANQELTEAEIEMLQKRQENDE